MFSRMLLTERNANFILPQYTVYSQKAKKLKIDKIYSNIFFITSVLISFTERNIQSIIKPVEECWKTASGLS